MILLELDCHSIPTTTLLPTRGNRNMPTIATHLLAIAHLRRHRFQLVTVVLNSSLALPPQHPPSRALLSTTVLVRVDDCRCHPGQIRFRIQTGIRIPRKCTSVQYPRVILLCSLRIVAFSAAQRAQCSHTVDEILRPRSNCEEGLGIPALTQTTHNDHQRAAYRTTRRLMINDRHHLISRPPAKLQDFPASRASIMPHRPPGDKRQAQ